VSQAETPPDRVAGEQGLATTGAAAEEGPASIGAGAVEVQGDRGTQSAPAGSDAGHIEARLASQEAADVSIRYLHAYAHVFDNPNWAMNITSATICQLIPGVGYMLAYGYVYENIEALHRKPRWTYPDFEFGRFGEYLARGVWPGLIVMVLAFVLYPVLWVAMYAVAILIAVAAMAAGEDYGGLTLSISIPVLLLTFAVAALLFVLLLRPMLLRAGLSQNIGEAFRVSWIWDFVRRVWVELLLTTLFAQVTFVVLGTLGTLLCIIGFYPALTLWLMATANLDYQLYQLYLSRGGRPIPLKPPPAYFAHVWR
jgi:hypothetical protein